jgi:hypothetical protein
MVPSWWRHWRVARRVKPIEAAPPKPAVVLAPPTEPGIEHPPRDGL